MSQKIILSLLLAAASAFLLFNYTQQKVDRFQSWKSQFGVEFQNGNDELYRRAIFERNLKQIEAHKANPENTYKMGINQFTSYTEEQFVHRFLNPINPEIPALQIQEVGQKVEAVIIDWVAKGAVGPVRNQGNCGSAVLYSTLGGVQGLSKIQSGTLSIFSSQQLLDCVLGCTGAQATAGYEYYKAHSVCTQAQYPTKGAVGTCQQKQCSFKITGYTTENTCDSLVNAIQKQPVSVAVDASKWATYSSGVFGNCGTAVNHMALLTGLADEYWKCKNSWGTAWGESGYIRLARGNTCGICSYSLYPY